MEIKLVNSSALNEWLSRYHYLHRMVIRSKLLAHGVFQDGKLVGGLLWATPHFVKKANLFGMEGTHDQWEVLMLARFYLLPESGLTASAVLSESIGRGRGSRGSKKRGWRLQADWVRMHPPVYPHNPFVPRLLISWSDETLPPIYDCPICGGYHAGHHKGTIYQACGWQAWDSTSVNYGRSEHEHMEIPEQDGETPVQSVQQLQLLPLSVSTTTQGHATLEAYHEKLQQRTVLKRCWILPLPANPVLEQQIRAVATTQQSFWSSAYS
jgi:hypothetical protein